MEFPSRSAISYKVRKATGQAYPRPSARINCITNMDRVHCIDGYATSTNSKIGSPVVRVGVAAILTSGKGCEVVTCTTRRLYTCVICAESCVSYRVTPRMRVNWEEKITSWI